MYSDRIQVEHSGSIVDISRKDCLVVSSDDLLEKPFRAAEEWQQLLETFETRQLQTKYSGVVLSGSAASSSSGGRGRGSAVDVNQQHDCTINQATSSTRSNAIPSAVTTVGNTSTTTTQPSQLKRAVEFWLRAGIRVKVTSKSFGPDVYLRRGTDRRWMDGWTDGFVRLHDCLSS